MYTREHLAMSNPKRGLEFGLIAYLRLKQRKGVWGFWVWETSHGKAIRESTVTRAV